VASASVIEWASVKQVMMRAARKPRAHDQYPQQKQQVIVTGENVSDPEQEEVRES
jgi:hypothetical protein